MEEVTDALNFSTADCHVVGGCDLYTTKAATADKKLYKSIENTLESQYASLLSFSASLSASQLASAGPTVNLSRSSPFGSLSQISARRTFAYLIATLNASHPDYDFSHLLRPSDFRHEKNVRHVINTLDTTLHNLRPRPASFTLPPIQYSTSRQSIPACATADAIDPHWSPRKWHLIDREMSLGDCSAYSFVPEEDPYDGEEGALWRFDYFFFNKHRKRVCYLYLRGFSLFSYSPNPKTPVKEFSGGLLDESEPGSSKRARYWLGDREDVAVGGGWEEDDDDDMDVEGELPDDEDDPVRLPLKVGSGSPSVSAKKRKKHKSKTKNKTKSKKTKNAAKSGSRDVVEPVTNEA